MPELTITRENINPANVMAISYEALEIVRAACDGDSHLMEIVISQIMTQFGLEADTKRIRDRAGD
jgi:hypothetical protein